MKKRKTGKDFATVKLMKIVGECGKLTEEDFERFKEKFEIIKNLYFDEKVGHEYFDGYRTIIKEVKRAAHNAGLKATISNLEYKSKNNNKIIEIGNECEFPVEFNFLIFITGGAKYTREYDFIVSSIYAMSNMTTLEGKYDSPVKYKVTVSDDMRDCTEISYYYIKGVE